MELSHALGSIPLSLSPDEPTDTYDEQLGEDPGGGVEGVDDALFTLQGDDFDEELAARIILQDEFGGAGGDAGSLAEEVADEL